MSKSFKYTGWLASVIPSPMTHESGLTLSRGYRHLFIGGRSTIDGEDRNAKTHRATTLTVNGVVIYITLLSSLLFYHYNVQARDNLLENCRSLVLTGECVFVFIVVPSERERESTRDDAPEGPNPPP